MPNDCSAVFAACMMPGPESVSVPSRSNKRISQPIAQPPKSFDAIIPAHAPSCQCAERTKRLPLPCEPARSACEAAPSAPTERTIHGSPYRGAGSRKLTERLYQICSDLSVSASPSHLPWKGRLGICAPQGFPYEGKAGMPPAVQKGADQICWPAPFCGLIFTHSIAIAVVFGSCFGALFGIESCRMPFSNFARISFGSRPSPT